MYELRFPRGIIILSFKNEKMVFKTEEGLGSLNPLNLELNQVINNIHIWHLTLINILRKRYDYKAEFRIPKEDFHMELMPFGTEGEAVLKVIHEQKQQGYVFKLKRPMIYTFSKILEDIDKILEIQDLFVRKEDGKTYFEDLVLPFQEKNSLRFLIERYIYFNEKPPRYFLTWDKGRIELTKSRIRLYSRIEDKFYPLKEIGINVEDLIKLMMVL